MDLAVKIEVAHQKSQLVGVPTKEKVAIDQMESWEMNWALKEVD